MKTVFYSFVLASACSACKSDDKPVAADPHSVSHTSSENSGQQAISRFDCYDGTQLEINACSAREFRYYDSLLTVKYDSLFQSEDEVAFRESLAANQEQWMNYRKAASELAGLKFQKGTMYPLIVNTQLTSETKNRIRFIESLSGR